MCGLAGLVNFAGDLSPEAMTAKAATMAETLAHRGPDDEGVWASSDGVAAFGFRRLSIIDLSPAGHQPMVRGDGRYVIVFNGEVYNFRELREQLEVLGHTFEGHADSEVAMASCMEWGVEAAIRRFNGMFAMAFWDNHERRLWLVRDRMGVKPLYWAQFGKRFLFGSELKALRAVDGWDPVLDRSSASAFLRHGYCPAPRTIYAGVQQLMPGCFICVSEAGAVSHQYWSLAEVAKFGVSNPLALDEQEAEEGLDNLLRSSVSSRMVADVPVGAFLSSGIDSSTVVAMMCATGGASNVRSFTIGFDDPAYDESARARRIADYLGTNHTELIMQHDAALEMIPSLSEWYDEPFADSSQIPTALVSRLARSQVTVSLSGDGGDELFLGYDRYFAGVDLWRKIQRVPKSLRKPLAGLLKAIPVSGWSAFLQLLPESWRPGSGGEAMHWMAGPLAQEPENLYRQMVSIWPNPENILPGATEARGEMWDSVPEVSGFRVEDLMAYLDGVTYLPDDILTKVDRASMAFGLEAREPLLDYRLVEFAWSLPPSMKMRDGTGKWLLRKVLARYVPTVLTDQPKQGFALPIGDWLRGPLRDWAEDLLAEPSTTNDLLHWPAVNDCWHRHLNGERGRESRLWAILMLQSWRRTWNI